MWHSAVDIRCIDFVAITAAYNWEPYLALMLGTAMAIQFAAGDTSVDSAGELPQVHQASHCVTQSRSLEVQ